MDVFGTVEGAQVMRAVLEDGDTQVAIMSYGAVTQDWQVAAHDGPRHVVLGFDKFEDYPAHSRSFGIIAGRVANRTAFGRFTLDGKTYQLATNNGLHHLHGGDMGLGRRIWNMEKDSAKNALRLTYDSPDGEDGYPGAVRFEVVIGLTGNTVTYDMSAVPDRVTPINLAQHNYYQLGGSSVRNHKVWLDAQSYTPVDDGLIPTGEIVPLKGTHFDYSSPATISDLDPDGLGVDLNFVLREGRDTSAAAARVAGPDGLMLTLLTDQPGVQVFNAPQMDIAVPGLDGAAYGAFGGLCLEPQHFPDGLNKPHFPPILYAPDVPYSQKLSVTIE